MKKTIYEIIDAAKKQKELDLKDIKEKLRQAESDHKQAAEKAAVALAAGDVDGYSRAKAEGRAAEDKVEFYQIRLNGESQSLFTAEEQTEMIAAIKSHYKSIEAEKIPVIKRLLEEAKAAAADMADEASKEGVYIGIAKNDRSNLPQELFALNGLVNSIENALNNSIVKSYNS